MKFLFHIHLVTFYLKSKGKYFHNIEDFYNNFNYIFIHSNICSMSFVYSKNNLQIPVHSFKIVFSQIQKQW